MIRPAELHISRSDGSGFFLTVKWDPGSMSFVCRTNLVDAALQKLLPAHIVEGRPASSSPASGSEFRLQAYMSNIPLLERLVAFARYVGPIRTV